MNDFTDEAEVDDPTAVEAEEVEETEETDLDDETVSEDVDDDQDDSEEDEDGEDEAEEIEFNFGGKKVQFPKGASVEEVAAELQTYASNIESAHTKRSQMIADVGKQLTERDTALQKLEGLQGATLEAYGKGLSIKAEVNKIMEAQQLPENSWENNPDGARRLSDLMNQKQVEFQQTVQEVSEMEQHSANERINMSRQQRSQGKAIVEKLVPGFEKEAPKVADYVKQTFGIQMKDSDEWAVNPAGAIMAFESMKYRELTQKAKKKAKPAVKEAVAMKSIKSKGSKASRPLNSPKISPEEYRERWNATAKKKYPR